MVDDVIRQNTVLVVVVAFKIDKVSNFINLKNLETSSGQILIHCATVNKEKMLEERKIKHIKNETQQVAINKSSQIHLFTR